MNIFKSKPVEEKTNNVTASFSAFRSHWNQVLEKMKPNQPQDSEAVLAVISNMSLMMNLLRAERGEENPQESCKTFWLQNKCSAQALKWLLDLKNKGLQLSREDDERLVVMLHSLCELVSRDSELLGSQSGSWEGACSLASLLLAYSFGNEVINGETARYSFILLIKLASRYPTLHPCLSQTGQGHDYINLIISGLTACFAQLPTYRPATTDEMRLFIQQLKFVDDITHCAPKDAAVAMAECFKNAFLDTIIRPSLTQDEENQLSLHTQHDRFVTSVYEEEAMVTKYLETISVLLTHPLLIKSLMKFIISLLPTTLLQRINHAHTSVTVSTLSLFNVLLDLYCEDLWFDLILQYLLPQNHRMVLQRKKTINEIDFYDASVRFLSLVPATIVDALGQDILNQHYLQYLNQESRRLAEIDTLGFGCISLHVPKENNDSTSSTNPIKNPIYPHWKLKYDGTDEYLNTGDDDNAKTDKPLCSTPKPTTTTTNKKTAAEESTVIINPIVLNGNSENNNNTTSNTNSIIDPESNIKTDVMEYVSSSPQQEQLDPLSFNTQIHDSNDVPDASVFANMSLCHHQTDLNDMSSIGLSVQSDSFGSDSSGQISNRINGNNFTVNSPMIQKVNNNVNNYENCTNSQGAKKLSSLETNSDGYSSFIETTSSSLKSENRASFGPFLDCLFDHLSNWLNLDQDQILMVTELLSLIAASRIPLISSIFLDPSIVLQPSYLSFASLLNRIRTELDNCLKNHPALILEVWNNLNKDSTNGGRTSSAASSVNSSLISNSFDNDSFNSPTSSFDNVTKRMFSGARAKLQSVFNKSFNSSPQQQTAPNDSQEVLQVLGGGQGYRYTNSHQNFQSLQQQHQQEQLKLMATRAIFFSHWMLEMAAISHQLCWKRTVQRESF